MIQKLSLLIGSWKGKGTANFPTIEKTDYIEELEFKYIGDVESILFEQKTWIINGEREILCTGKRDLLFHILIIILKCSMHRTASGWKL